MVDSFCGCAKLETGGIVLGILGMIANVCLIIGSLVAVIYVANQEKTNSEDETLMTCMNPKLSTEKNIYLLFFFISVVKIVGVTVIIVGILYLISSVYLYLGTKQRRPGYVRVWLVASMISIVLSCFQILRGFVAPDFTIIFQIISFCVSIYWWICIKELNEVFIRERASQDRSVYQPRDGDRKYAPQMV